VQLLHGLGHDVGGGVAQHLEALGLGDQHPLHGVPVGQPGGEVLEHAVDPGHHHGAVLAVQVRGGRPGPHRALLAVDGDREGGGLGLVLGHGGHGEGAPRVGIGTHRYGGRVAAAPAGGAHCIDGTCRPVGAAAVR
jgi:hypothetical protein